MWLTKFLLCVIALYTTIDPTDAEGNREMISNITTIIANEVVNASQSLAKRSNLDDATRKAILQKVSDGALEKVGPKVKELAEKVATKAVQEAQANTTDGKDLPIEQVQKIFLNATTNVIKQIANETAAKSYEQVAESAAIQSINSTKDIKEQARLNETLGKTLKMMF